MSNLYKHKDGGVYRLEYDSATGTTDGSTQYVVYTHMYPYDMKVWVRPKSEWTEDRFVPISEVELIELVSSMPRLEYRAKVTEAKQHRKAVEARIQSVRDL